MVDHRSGQAGSHVGLPSTKDSLWAPKALSAKIGAWKMSAAWRLRQNAGAVHIRDLASTFRKGVALAESWGRMADP